MADYFNERHFGLTLAWTSPTHSTQIQALNLTGFSFLFAIAFFWGLITLNLLAHLREEGEVSRDTVLESLVNPMCKLSRPLNWILPSGFSHRTLYKYLKRIPIPGLDVAMSVVAYELVDAARLMVKAGLSGRKSLHRWLHLAAIRLNLKLRRKPVG
jgi:hypothetical protein